MALRRHVRVFALLFAFAPAYAVPAQEQSSDAKSLSGSATAANPLKKGTGISPASSELEGRAPENSILQDERSSPEKQPSNWSGPYGGINGGY
jgi:hypothetical protein